MIDIEGRNFFKKKKFLQEEGGHGKVHTLR